MGIIANLLDNYLRSLFLTKDRYYEGHFTEEETEFHLYTDGTGRDNSSADCLAPRCSSGRGVESSARDATDLGDLKFY